MARSLDISIGQHSGRGRKPINQDFYGALVPPEPLLSLKGIAVVVADGISTSPVSREAAESAVKALLTDYYCTSATWTVKTAAHRVIAATNSWLYAQTRRSRSPGDHDRGYVCTLSAVVFKAGAAHVFHIGDSRVWRLSGRRLEQLTEDHRVVVSEHESYLGRALGIGEQVEIDYRMLPLAEGDVFVLATDGVGDVIDGALVADAIAAAANDLDAAARAIVQAAYERGSDDNLTVQIVRVETLPRDEAGDVLAEAASLPLPPLLDARQEFDGYRILRTLHASSRSHIYLALDLETQEKVVLKAPSVEMADDAAHLRRFLIEEWIAQRVDNAHVLKAHPPARRRHFLYVVMEYVEGISLAQWMIDHPGPDIAAVRDILGQAGRGLQALHRREMLHQDLRPQNIMIERNGTVKLIDFGSARVAGVTEGAVGGERREILGTLQYTAPEYFLGAGGSARSDVFSLGVIAYQMLTGRLPYGPALARARSRRDMRKLTYEPARSGDRDLPVWIDGALAKAVSLDPARRYAEVAEFLRDLHHPDPAFLQTHRPLAARNPLLFWKGLSAALLLLVLFLLARLNGTG